MTKNIKTPNPAAAGSNTAAISGLTKSNVRNLTIEKRNEICKLWFEFLEATTLSDEFEAPVRFSRVNFVGSAGKTKQIQILKVKIVFHQFGVTDSPTEEVLDPSMPPTIGIHVNHTKLDEDVPEFVDAIDRILTEHIKKPVRVELVDSQEETSCLITADPESSWKVAEFMLKQVCC